jgi:hypothetical protein
VPEDFGFLANGLALEDLPAPQALPAAPPPPAPPPPADPPRSGPGGGLALVLGGGLLTAVLGGGVWQGLQAAPGQAAVATPGADEAAGLRTQLEEARRKADQAAAEARQARERADQEQRRADQAQARAEAAAQKEQEAVAGLTAAREKAAVAAQEVTALTAARDQAVAGQRRADAAARRAGERLAELTAALGEPRKLDALAGRWQDGADVEAGWKEVAQAAAKLVREQAGQGGLVFRVTAAKTDVMDGNEKLGTVPQGTELPVMGLHESGWVQVKWKDGPGASPGWVQLKDGKVQKATRH